MQPIWWGSLFSSSPWLMALATICDHARSDLLQIICMGTEYKQEGEWKLMDTGGRGVVQKTLPFKAGSRS